MKKILNNKKILITAGPTWVAIDAVRVITSIFSGSLGVLIAKNAQKAGAKVTLLLGPGEVEIPLKNKNIRIIRFQFFDELLNLVKREIASKKYDAVIHTAAVSDYRPIITFKQKIKSNKKQLNIKLKPTLKIVDFIKKIDPKVFLVKFKLEVNLPEKKLIEIAYKSLQASKADLIVANDLRTFKKKHRAIIIDPQKNFLIVEDKKQIAKSLVEIIGKFLN